MDSEQTQNFNERLSQWVSNQGFWFQIRYSMSNNGMKGQAMFHILRMAFRIAVFLLVIGVGCWIYLLKRPSSPKFSAEYREDIKAALTAKELEIAGFQPTHGQMELGRLAAQGGSGTFFESIEARNILFKMGILDGLVGVWQPGMISIGRVEIDLRAGTNDADDATKLAESIFRRSQKVNVDSFEVADATIRWGYSERTQGAIESSALRMQRTESGWRLQFKGGTFQQNWLKRLEIVELVVLANPEGIVFERAELKKENSTVEFPGLRVSGGERPVVNGTVKVRHLVLADIVPPALRTFIEGSISGDFKVSGSTNSSDGIAFEGQVVLSDPDFITLRDRFHLLEALSVVDYSRNYHRVDFREGSFQMRSQEGGLKLTEVDLKAEEMMSLKGEIMVRLPNQEEIAASVAGQSEAGGSAIYAAEDDLINERGILAKDSNFSLKKAAQEARRIQEGNQSIESLSLFDRLGMGIEMRRLQSQASERTSRMLRYDGEVKITIQADAFERAPRLMANHPPDPVTGRIMLDVPINGHIFELTLKQAEDLYQQGKR